MLPELDSLAGDMAAAILREVPGYGRIGDGSSARIVRRVARDAVHQFAARIADPASPAGPMAQVFRDIGRAEAAGGRGLDALHAALRVGGRVTWQRLREQAAAGGGDADVLARIGEAIFRYLDELAAACSAGYAEATAEFAGETGRLRHRLLDLLLSDPPAPPEAVSSVARAIGWRLPRRVAVVALAERATSTAGPLPPLPAGVLAGLARREPCLLVPDPDGPGRFRLLEAGLRGWPASGGAASGGAPPGGAASGGAPPGGAASGGAPSGGPGDGTPAGCLAAVGPVVPLGRAGGSLRWARRALALARRGQVRGANGIVRCDEHLATLVLLADPELAGMLSGQALAPLRRLRPGQADRLAETLLAWLESADNAETAARRLHVHPQTVRYRLRQLTELFGDRLSDPDARFTLQVALRVRRLSRTTACGPGCA
jgi:hypothetical protein